MTTQLTTRRSDLTGTYQIDPTHSRLGFVARHAMVSKVRGQFNEFEGSLEIDGDSPTESRGTVTIQAASIDTNQADRDAHLRSNDFFAMDEYPEIAFVSTGITDKGGDNFEITGDLTLKGVTKPVTFQVKFLGAGQDPYGNTRLGLEGYTEINRKDWGVNWNVALEAGGLLVSEKITVEFEIAAVKV